MGSSGSLWTQLLTVFILTAINAVFAASELAFVSVNQTKLMQLADEGNKKAKKVLALLENSDDFLATIQVAITLAGFLSSASAATSFADRLAPYLSAVPGAQTLAVVIVTLILSYLTLVLGELFPKQIALQMPERIAMATAGPVGLIKVFFKPFVNLLSLSTGLLQKITPIEFSKTEEKFTRDEMKVILQESRKEGSIDLTEFTMLQGVLSLDNKLAREIMVPRTDTLMIDIEDDYHENLDTILNSPYSRIPVYQDDKDNVIGIIHLKNIVKAAQKQGFDNIDIKEIMTEPLVVPSTMFIDDLLIEFRRIQTHLAILFDEYGGVEGIVTLEDILEEIVGEIEDESDVDTNEDITKMDDNYFYINGGIAIEKFNQYFDLELEAEEVDTLAGLIIYHIGYVPDDDEQIHLRAGQYVLTTSAIENGRIRGIQLVRDANHDLEVEYDLSSPEEQAKFKESLEELIDDSEE